MILDLFLRFYTPLSDVLIAYGLTENSMRTQALKITSSLYAHQPQAVVRGQEAERVLPLHPFGFEKRAGHCSDRCRDHLRSGHEVSYDAGIIRRTTCTSDSASRSGS